MKSRYIVMLPWVILAAFWTTVILYSCGASADEIQIMTTSRHFNKDPNKWYNETNPGVLYAHNVTDNWKAIGGGYRNTYKEITWTVGGEYQSDKWNGISVGGQLGLGTGYKQLTGKDLSVVGSLFGQYNPLVSEYRRSQIGRHATPARNSA